MSEERVQNTEQMEPEQDLSEILRIRREKLAALRSQGKDPFAITVCERDTPAADIVNRFEELEGKDVAIARPYYELARYGKGQLYGFAGPVRPDSNLLKN